MKKRNAYLFSLAFIYAVLFFCKKSGLHFFLIGDYAADLICIPLSLLFIEWLMEKVPGNDFKMDGWKIFAAVIYFSIVFEGIMPAFSSDFTRDYLDVVMYGAGGMIYYFFTSVNYAAKPMPNRNH